MEIVNIIAACIVAYFLQLGMGAVLASLYSSYIYFIACSI